MLRRLALSGLKGRPKQTLILLSTMMLAFFFVTIAMNLLSTSHVNRAEQRRDTFGEWSRVYIADTPVREALLHQTGETYGRNRILGLDSRFGVVASYDDTFRDLSRIQVMEGDFPTKLDEIVLTESQVSFFEEKPTVGDTVTVTLEVARSEAIPFQLHPEIEPAIRRDMQAADRYIAEHWDAYAERILSAEAGWKQDQARMVSGYLRDLYSDGIPMDEVAERERYIRLTDAAFERKIALFADTPEAIDERLRRIATYHEAELEAQIDEAATDPWFLYRFGRTLTPEELRREILYQFSLEGRIARFMAHATPRNSSDLEGHAGTIFSTRRSSGVVRYHPDQLAILSRLYEHLPMGGIDGIPMEQNFIRQSHMVLHRDMVISGIIENYQQVWDGPITQYATAFVSEETAEQLIEKGLHLSAIAANQTYETPLHLFIRAREPTLTQPGPSDPINLFVNNLAFGQESGISEEALSLALLFIIAFITCFSILQISLIQFRKRLRKLALLRAIGATFSQLRRLMAWESVYLIAFAFPSGSLLGFLLSYLLIGLNNAATGDQLQLRINPTWLLLGYGLTLLSILIGLFLPMLQVGRVPLRGHVPITNRRTVKSTRDRLGDLAMTRQSLSSINRRHHRFIRKQQLIQLGLMSAILLILIGSYLLIYLSFGNYREKTLHADMPDFELEAPFQQNRRTTQELQEQLMTIDGVEQVEIFVRGLKTFLWYEGINDTPLSRAFQQVLPPELLTEHYGTSLRYEVEEETQTMMQQAAVTDIYGIVPDSPLEQAMRRILPSDFDITRFRREQQAILLLPGYELTTDEVIPVEPARLDSIERANRMRDVLQLAHAGTISYDIRRSPALRHDHRTDTLTEVRLAIPTGGAIGPDNRPTNHVKEYRIPIVSVLNHLPEEGFWPLSDSIQNPILFVSQYTMEGLYPYRMHSVFTLDTVRRYFGEEPAVRFGSTIIQIDQTDITQDGATEIKRIGFRSGFHVKSLYLQKQALYMKGVRTSLIIGLLAATLLLIATQIQLGTFRGHVEVERQRIGILQSLGVTVADFRKAYFKEALWRVAQAFVITHLVLAIGLFLYVALAERGGDLLTRLRITLWDYNWLWHALISLVFAGLGVMANYLPVGSILNRRPVENIRSLQ